MNKKQTRCWTLTDMKSVHTTMGGFFFSHATMRGFGDTLRSFKVENDDDGVWIVRVRDARHKPECVASEIGKRYLFNPDTGRIVGE